MIGVPRFHETLTDKCKRHFLPQGFKACDCDNGLDRSEAMNSEGGLDQHMTSSQHVQSSWCTSHDTTPSPTRLQGLSWCCRQRPCHKSEVSEMLWFACEPRSLTTRTFNTTTKCQETRKLGPLALPPSPPANPCRMVTSHASHWHRPESRWSKLSVSGSSMSS